MLVQIQIWTINNLTNTKTQRLCHGKTSLIKQSLNYANHNGFTKPKDILHVTSISPLWCDIPYFQYEITLGCSPCIVQSKTTLMLTQSIWVQNQTPIANQWNTKLKNVKKKCFGLKSSNDYNNTFISTCIDSPTHFLPIRNEWKGEGGRSLVPQRGNKVLMS